KPGNRRAPGRKRRRNGSSPTCALGDEALLAKPAPRAGDAAARRGRRLHTGPMPSIAILNYGMGTLRSVQKALERVGAEAELVNDPGAARAADGLVLPGVGAFPAAMRRVRELGLDALLSERLDAGTPVLGI